jgi:hypothetical protein
VGDPVTASKAVRDAWNAAIWPHPSIAAMTDKVFLHDVSQESEFELAKLYSEADGEGPRLNFFLCIVTRRQEPLICLQTRYTFVVEVQYYLQQTDNPESTQNTLVDRLEAVDDLVRPELGATWGGTVEYYQGGVPQKLALVTIDNRKCWKGGYTYTAFKTA